MSRPLFFSAFSLVMLLPSSVHANGLLYPLGDVRNCAGVQGRDPNNPLLHVDVLPGLGFDNLRNLDLGQVLDYNYSTCQVSGDGLYLVPDSVYLIPAQESKMDMFAEYFDTFQEYTSHTAASINFQLQLSIMFSSISGSFSADYQSTKSKMVKLSRGSHCARVSLRYKLYTAHIPTDAQLHGAFKSRLLDIAANIQNNNTKLAHYLAESLVRDYGTHVITSIDAGAGLSKITFVSKSSFSSYHGSDRSIAISQSAGGGFLFFFQFHESLTASYTSSSETKAELDKGTTSTHILTYGGPMFRFGNYSLTDWENGVRDHTVTIDRSGVPLHSVINSNNVPELPDSTLLAVMDYVYQAVARYYKVNTITGCMNSSSPKFNFQANLDDGSCNEERTTYHFGGIYQTCTTDGPDDFCSSYRQTNPALATEGYTCPPNYTSILLYTGTLGNAQKARECRKHCTIFNLFCHENCWTKAMVYPATYNAYWCAHSPHSPADVGIMFGGVYTSSQQNVVTGSSSCPPFFYALHFGENIWVCVSQDKEGAQYSIPFGGFHSCTNGNPMASTSNQFNKGIYPHRCSKHYSQFLVTIDEGCDIYYCADTASLRQQQPAQPQPPKLPPYHALPRMSLNVTNTLVVRGTNGKVWIKNDDGTWQEYKDGQQTSKEYLISLAQEAASPNNNEDNDNTDNGDNSGGSIAVMVGVVIGSVAGTVLVGAAIALVVFGIRKVKHSRRVRRGNEQCSSSAYLVINDETDSTARSHGSTDTAACNSNV